MRNSLLVFTLSLLSGLATPDRMSAQASCVEFNESRPSEQVVYVNGVLAGLGAAAHITQDIAEKLVAMRPPETGALPDTMTTVSDLFMLPEQLQVFVVYQGAIANVGELTIGELVNRVRALCARPDSTNRAAAKIIAEVVNEVMTLKAWGKP